jgi:hypothetical protein
MLFLRFLLDNFKMYDIFSHFLSNVLNYGVNFKCLKYINDFKRNTISEYKQFRHNHRDLT